MNNQHHLIIGLICTVLKNIKGYYNHISNEKSLSFDYIIGIR